MSGRLAPLGHDTHNFGRPTAGFNFLLKAYQKKVRRHQNIRILLFRMHGDKKIIMQIACPDRGLPTTFDYQYASPIKIGA